MMLNRCRAAAILACALAAGCGSSSAPSAVSNPSQCRTYQTQFTRRVIYTGFTSPDETSTCVLDSAGSTLSCSGPFTLAAGCGGSLTTTYRYGSLSDFIAEARAVGSVLETQEQETLNRPSSCGVSGTGIVNFTYDSSKRLQVRDASSPSSAMTLRVAYNGWDSVLRPTSGIETGNSVPSPCSATLSYDDQSRTFRNAVVCTAPASTGEERITYDANGNIVAIQESMNGAVVSAETRSIDRTDTVCNK